MPPFTRVLALAVLFAAVNPLKVTHTGAGEVIVERMASNRRIMGDDGKVAVVRFTATRDPALRALPVGRKSLAASYMRHTFDYGSDRVSQERFLLHTNRGSAIPARSPNRPR